MELPPIRNLTSSAEYRYIDSALKSLWRPFVEIVEEMETYKPRSIAEFAEEREKLLQRERELSLRLEREFGGNRPNEWVVSRVDTQIELAHKYQFSEKFSTPFKIQYVLITTTSHALCEAVINTVLALGLAHTDSQELFPLIEKAELKKKWLIGPRMFCADYKLDAGTAMFETLKELNNQRNNLMHHKIEVLADGKKVLQGSGSGRQLLADEVKSLKRFFSLPYDLAEQANRQLNRHGIYVLADRDPIQKAESHSLPTG